MFCFSTSDWKKFEIFIGEQPAGYQVDFMGDPIDTKKSQIAIDDVEFLNCAKINEPTDQSLDCDFENGFCYYYPDKTSDFYWQRGDGSDYNGPLFDHTTGKGYFIYVDSFYPQKSGDIARITSSKQTKVNKEFCFTFWYHMFGSTVGSLNMYVDKFVGDSFNRTKMWEKDGTQGNQWNEQKITLMSSDPWKVTFEGIVGKMFYGDIALDDLSMVEGPCERNKLKCDFEIDLCDYKQHYGVNWTRGQPSKDSIDHTFLTNEGNFAYIEFFKSRGRARGSLISDYYVVDMPRCLSFWYFINGAENAQLFVQETDSRNITELWTKKSHMNDEWRYGQTTVGFAPNGTAVIFEALYGDTNAIIGIDDIEMMFGPCPEPLSCDFEDMSTCSWLQSKNDVLDWEFGQGKTAGSLGPSVDHTINDDDGVYLKLDSNYYDNIGDNAILTSEYIPGTNGELSCFRLWYYMHGETAVGELNIFLNSSGSYRLLMGLNGEQGASWQQLNVDLQSQEEFRIYIEGVVLGNGKKGIIAIDDVEYFKGSCSSPHTTTIPTTIEPITTVEPTITTEPITTTKKTTTSTSTTTTTTTTSTTTTTTTPKPVKCYNGYCKNGGVCYVNTKTNRLECNCPSDFTGDQCRLPKNSKPTTKSADSKNYRETCS